MQLLIQRKWSHFSNLILSLLGVAPIPNFNFVTEISTIISYLIDGTGPNGFFAELQDFWDCEPGDGFYHPIQNPNSLQWKITCLGHGILWPVTPKPMIKIPIGPIDWGIVCNGPVGACPVYCPAGYKSCLPDFQDYTDGLIREAEAAG